jgi:NTE family protein
VVIVHINPIERPDVPRTAGEILNRINEISFNSSLMREMRSVYFVTKLIEEEKILDKTIRRMLIHSIEADDVMQAMGVGSKLNADRDQINKLMTVGRGRAEAWLAANFDRLGKRSTIDIQEKYL